MPKQSRSKLNSQKAKSSLDRATQPLKDASRKFWMKDSGMADTFEPRAHVAHMEKMLGLTIEDDWRPVVEMHIAAIEKAAEAVLDFPLEDHAEAAPVFVP